MDSQNNKLKEKIPDNLKDHVLIVLNPKMKLPDNVQQSQLKKNSWDYFGTIDICKN